MGCQWKWDKFRTKEEIILIKTGIKQGAYLRGNREIIEQNYMGVFGYHCWGYQAGFRSDIYQWSEYNNSIRQKCKQANDNS